MKRLGKIQTFALAAVAGLALATPFAIAQTGGGDGQGKDGGKRGEWGGRRGGGRGHFGGGMFRGIELTEEQQTRLQQIRQSFGESSRTLRQQLRAKHEEVRQAGEGNTFNEALAAQKLTEAAALQARLMAEEFRMRQESLSVLTAEQKAQMEQRRAERSQKREERRNRRGERRGPGGPIL
jgi:protein CpxP